MKSESCEKPPRNPLPQGSPGPLVLEGPGGSPPTTAMKSESCTPSGHAAPGPSRRSLPGGPWGTTSQRPHEVGKLYLHATRYPRTLQEP
eukprot:NODE_7446_length_567_cov_9.001931_g6432_i0.p3 GENE.NODE_7446_length_567_cov_9.001931_g6432_i0~~NODE_7446_length_567_cov_9.001931_g6432_i0.p3  ORF type:complete len:89 (+),score=1.58 NODE_7446_length_567_cov_9.001931_g6432_i0:119-385(+)